MDRLTVTREDLGRDLARIASGVEDPRAGLFGPEAMVWRLGRESINFLGAGRAALLQLAHPFIAHAIDQHSETRDAPQRRFRRTFENMYGMLFGDLETALASARRVHAVHERIEGQIAEDVGSHRQGDRYHANFQPALMWVHATLIDTSMVVHELILGPLSEADKERYYRESKVSAALFGITDAVLPPSWPAFQRYVGRMFESDELAVGTPAAEMGRFLLHPGHPALAGLFAWYRLVTASLMPPRLGRAFGLSITPTQRRLVDLSLRALAPIYRALPDELRFVPAYLEARRRIAGARPSRSLATAAQALLLQLGQRMLDSYAD